MPSLSDGSIRARDRIFEIFGRENVSITSGARTRQHNHDIGGSNSSAHITGNAFDFVVANQTPQQVAATILDSNIGNFDQLIFYPDRGHVHFGVANNSGQQRGQILESVGKRFVSRTRDQLGKAVDGAKARATGIINGAIGGFIKSGGNPIGAISGGVGGILGGKSIFQQIIDFFNDSDFWKRLAMGLIGLMLIVLAVGWLGKSTVTKNLLSGVK